MELRKLNQEDILFKKAGVQFPSFEVYKKDALEIAEYIKSIEVTEENIKSVKSDLAAARKVVDALNAKRIEIKKSILEEFNVFESQVKELSQIIADADEETREKVRELEEIQRQAKMDLIDDLWGKKAWNYKINMYSGAFDLWFRPKLLNKTMSMNAVEADLTEWLERTERELETLSGMGEEYCTEYYSCADMNAAISAVNARERIRKEVEEEDDDPFEYPKATFTIYGKKDIALAEMLLEQNGIEYIKH